MPASYTYDVFSTLDGFASYAPPGDWGGYWGKQGPQFLEYRQQQYSPDQRMVFGSRTYAMFERFAALRNDSEEFQPDGWGRRMEEMPTTVISSTLDQGQVRPAVSVVGGDAVDAIARLKEESPVPLRSHGSISLNRALLDAGLVDVVELTVFPVISGQTGAVPIFAGVADFDLDMLSSVQFDGRIQVLTFRPRRR